MPRRSSYDRAYGYDRPYGPGRGYGQGRYDGPIGGRYDASLGRHPGPGGTEPYLPYAYTPAPYIPFGWDPMMRWGGWGPGIGYVPYPDEPPPAPRRTPPRRSPTYGRRGDAEATRWARGHGYEVERTIRPRRSGHHYDR